MGVPEEYVNIPVAGEGNSGRSASQICPDAHFCGFHADHPFTNAKM